MMLYLEAQRVDMSKAVRDDHPRNGEGGFARVPGQAGVYSPSGVWGDPTLASVDKGRRIVNAVVDGIVRDIQCLRQAVA